MALVEGTPEQILHCIILQNLFLNAYHTTTILRPFFRDHPPGELMPEESVFWTLWC